LSAAKLTEFVEDMGGNGGKSAIGSEILGSENLKIFEIGLTDPSTFFAVSTSFEFPGDLDDDDLAGLR